MADQEEDFSSLSLTDRFVHKNWKVRKEAYEAAAKEFDNAQTESDPVVKQFVQDPGLWKGAVTDSNAAAHQEALNALCSFLQIAGKAGCTRTRSTAIAPLAEKGLIASKPSAKQKAQEAILLYIEMDIADPVIDELLPLLSHKLPKIIAAVLNTFTAIYHAFGVKTVEPKPVLKTLPKVYGHADKNVRAEAQNLTVELYRWLREGMKPLFWNELKPVQQQDIEKAFEKVKNEPPPKPERLLKSQQAAAAAAAAAPQKDAEEVGEAEGDEDVGEVDLEPEYMAVDVLPKIPKDLLERLGSSKWKDRKEALDELHSAVNVPAIEDGHFHEIMQALAKCMKDANVGVVVTAANCIELLAKGLKKSFARYRSTVMPAMIERLKEKKLSVTDAIAAAMDAVCASTTISDNLEEILAAMANKNPQIKIESTKFLVRALKSTREAPSVPETKSIAETCTKLLTDSQDTQRNAAAEVLGILWKIMGDRIMNTHLDGLDDIRKAKIKEYMESAEVKSKYKPKAAAPPAPKATPAGLGKKSTVKKPTGSATPAAKKSTPARAAPVSKEPTSPPPQPKSLARPGGLPKPGAGGTAPRSLKPPTAGGRKLATPASAASPKRPSQASPVEEDSVPPPKPLSRGLTGRTLAKPSASNIESTQPAQPAQPQPSSAPTPLPSAERLELDELRAEATRLRGTNESLRSDNLKLSSQVNELQDQNAQLIEDHTRDVLSIKAKETQLVRARSDAETAEQSVGTLQREVERLKRELGRMGRASSPRASDISAMDIFPSAGDPGSAGAGAGAAAAPAGNTLGDPRSRATVMSPVFRGEGKENTFPGNVTGASPGASFKNRTLSPTADESLGLRRPDSRGSPKKAVAAPPPPPPPPPSSATRRPLSQNSGGSSGQQQPNGTGLNADGEMGSSGSTNGFKTSGGESSSDGTGAPGGGQGVHSWQRAAEVTQNLKARIEMMKKRQAAQGGGGGGR
ncbi:MAG: Microtubule-associated protein, microtubule dynamics during spindle orientation [Alyxoria varia]|nr:MAG: Microtubule-associated protein, microtubule dynamics during spindle orientation [Alyxoria varia]